MLRKRLSLYLFFITIPVFLMTYESVKGPFNTHFYISYPLFYINEAFSSLKYYIKKPFVAIFLLNSENAQLKEELIKLKIREQQVNEALEENRRLRNFISFRYNTSNYITNAKVIAKGPGAWSQLITLDKGKIDGVEKDMAVRTINGLVGKIFSVYRNHSMTLLLTDINSSAAVRLSESRIEGILSGTGSVATALKYIPNNVEVSLGEILITSGLDEIFPSGIPVGKIMSVEKSTTSLFQTIEVEPFSNPLTIEEAIIVGHN